MAPARAVDRALLSVVCGGDQAEMAGVKLCIDCHERPPVARKRCRRCYQAWRRTPDFRRIQHAAHLVCFCGKPANALGLCQAHYMRLYRNGDPVKAAPKQKRPPRLCMLCDRPHKAYGYCHMHYRRWKAGKNPAVVTMRDVRLSGG